METPTTAPRAEGDGFAKLFERIAEAALLVDTTSGMIVEANHAARDLLGYSREDLGHVQAADLHPHELPAFERFVEAVLSEGAWEQDELSCRTKCGRFVPARVRATYVEVFNRSCILVVVHDLRGEQLAALGQAVRKIAHDLRNTLTTTLLLGERLGQHDDRDVQRSAERVTRSLERALALCQRTLTAGSAKEPPAKPERVAIRRLVDDMLADLDARAVTVENAAPAGLIGLVDPHQLYRAALNVAGNAVRAPGTTTVRVEGYSITDGVAVDVVDDGPGLPDAMLRHGWRSARGSAAEGTGLGLTIADELISANGGQLDLVTTDGTGTRFRITIPAADTGPA